MIAKGSSFSGGLLDCYLYLKKKLNTTEMAVFNGLIIYLVTGMQRGAVSVAAVGSCPVEVTDFLL